VMETKEARETLKRAQEAEITQLRGFLPICSYCIRFTDSTVTCSTGLSVAMWQQ